MPSEAERLATVHVYGEDARRRGEWHTAILTVERSEANFGMGWDGDLEMSQPFQSSSLRGKWDTPVLYNAEDSCVK